ncbi:MAG: hypothetical protein KKB65_05695, partial [Nanoarchaeota archaeon]|nr:hypothetical protein [Nanoarchaeota archaeon]
MNRKTENRILVIVMILLAIALVFKASITGFTIKETLITKTLNINLETNTSEQIQLTLEQQPRSISVSGRIIGDGRVVIKLVDGTRELIIYNNQEIKTGLEIITGMITFNQTTSDLNVTQKEIIINISETIEEFDEL